MFPLNAVIVHHSQATPEPLRLGLIDNAVTIAEEFPTVDAMLQRWPSPPDTTRRLIVIQLRSVSDVEKLSRLEGHFPGWPVLAVVEGDVDTTSLFQVSRAGASQILPFPFDPLELEKSLDRLLLQFGLRESPSIVIAISGVIEGCGATSLSMNLAAELAAIGEIPVVLTEMSLGMGRLATQLDLNPTMTTQELLTDDADPSLATVKAALTAYNEHLLVLAGQTKSLNRLTPPPGRLHKVVRCLRQVSNFIVMDMPYTFDPDYFQALLEADQIFLVTRQNVPSVQSAKVIRDALYAKGIKDIGLIVNQYDSELKSFSTSAMKDLLQLNPVVPVADDGPGHQAAIQQARLLREVVPASRSITDIRALAATILEQSHFPVHLPIIPIWDRLKTALNRFRNS